MKTKFLILLFCLGALYTTGQVATEQKLHGEWVFALDPINIGEKENWFAPDFPINLWDKVTVPHCFSVDPRYLRYTGTAWYIRKFSQQSLPKNHRAFIRFEAVYYKSSLWLNGKKIGEHEGGYTPFEFDITDQLSGENSLALKVNNAWDTTTIPGAKTKVNAEKANNSQVFPWINYGGINREVYIIIKPEVHINRLKIVSEPDLQKNTASVAIQAFITNKSSQPFSGNVIPSLYFGKRKIATRFKSKPVTIAANGQGVVLLETQLSAGDVKLWNHDEPNLYEARLVLGTDTIRSTFGIRKVEVRGARLLLNGEPIRMGGGNRPLDYPKLGSMDPVAVMEKDLQLMKSGGMELSRINHHPVSSHLLDWADQHGLLIITEPGNWQLTPKQMADPAMRKNFESQFREMIQRDWNHPSVIAYSVGNEYPSQTPEGQAWTKDMRDFAKQLDPSRLVTFASMFVWRDFVKKPEDEASQYVDFISANIYGGFQKLIQHIHDVYPDKAVYISEFGVRADAKSEEDQIKYLRNAVNDFRQFDFVIGASVWTFNDYESVFPGTNKNGYRPWGLVAPDRKPRGTYQVWKEEFSPATLEVHREGEKIVINVTARKDFPSYTLRNYSLEVGKQIIPIPPLKPGEEKNIDISLPSGRADEEYVLRLRKPGGYEVLRHILNMKANGEVSIQYNNNQP
ncbi:MAG TPA: glycoside hydrolase family 2 TIM barrel-domain containing protein [Chryseolinea sp.]|nr:glycoside hydrolase family 2 TIM barrel-domain containing protein [Chryseolinea sp.]